MFLDGGQIWKNVIVVAKQVGYHDDDEELGNDNEKDFDCDDDEDDYNDGDCDDL